ncbi:MAG: IS1595 family transposase [Gallionella sp.]|nr:IS1595 family transposase [Gallionella sp.]
MKSVDFKEWLSGMDRLSRGQREAVIAEMAGQVELELGVKVIEASVGDTPSCPHCQSQKLHRWGHDSGLQRYRCCGCARTFNALTDTPLARLHYREKWIKYQQAMLDGLSIRDAAKACGIAKNTSLQWRHRFLRTAAAQKPAKMTGIVEADETFFLESKKGQRNIDRKARKRGGTASKRGLSAEQIPVLVVRDRHGETADFILGKVDAEQVKQVLKPLLNQDTLLCTDGALVYKAVAKQEHITHRPVNLAAGKRVIGGVYHVQNVNAYHSRLKKWMGKFNGVATHYLANYLGWHRMKDRFGENTSPADWLANAINRTGQFQQRCAT